MMHFDYYKTLEFDNLKEKGTKDLDAGLGRVHDISLELKEQK